MSRDPNKLQVFHDAHHLVLAIHQLSDQLPVRERFGLQSQLRRAAVSIASNIVEGSSRRTASDYARFLEIALGSASEVKYLLRLCGDLGVLHGAMLEECRSRCEHVVRALQRLHTAVSRFPARGPKPEARSLKPEA